MKELKNVVSVTGELVKKDLSEFTTKKDGTEAIGGSLVLRTADGSEHEINFYANKYKKDENKNFTSEESYFYKKYKDAMETLKDMEHCAEGEHADVISITDGAFTANDFKGNDNKVVSTNKISAKFINKIEPKDYDSTVLEAKFEVEGVVESIKDEIVKDVPSGNLVVNMLAIRQKADGFGKDAKYEVDSLIPIRMLVNKDMATAFRTAGYYDGCFTKFVGSLINSVEKTKVVEKAAFGSDIEKEVKSYIRRNEIKSGTVPSTIFEHELTQEVFDALRANRKAKLAEVASGKAVTDDAPFTPDKSTPAPQTTYNPFAQK